MCTSQPDFSRSRKAWEDIISSPRAAQARAQATDGNKENAPMSAARSRQHSVDGPLAPKRGAFSPQRRYSTGDEPERDNEVEVEEATGGRDEWVVGRQLTKRTEDVKEYAFCYLMALRGRYQRNIVNVTQTS